MARWSGQENLKQIPEKIQDEYRKRAMAAMERVIEQAVADYRRFTSTRPSAKSGKEGRIETAAMLNAVTGRTFTEGMDKIVGEFGFLGDQELYYLLQTVTGFTHAGGEMIRPTLALRDAAVLAVQNLIEEMGKTA